jgi:hypothetical protein
VRALGTLVLLANTAEGRKELSALRHRPVLCFTDVRDGVLQEPGVLVLPNARSNRLNAARAAHLLLHQLEGPPLDEGAVRSQALSCEALTRRAMRREVAAYAAQARVAQSLGVFLPNVPPASLERAYGARCLALRRRAP